MNNKTKKVVFFITLVIFLMTAISVLPTTAKAAKKNGQCSLELSSQASSSNISFGDSVVYNYSLKNVGTTSCSGASVSLYYADNEQYVSSSLAPRASDNYWVAGNLARGKSYSFSVTMKNIPSDSSQMFGEACASANGADDSCVSEAVNLTPVTLNNESTTVDTATTSLTTAPIVVPISEPIDVTNNTQAWIYPGAPACGSANEYADGRNIDTLKPEYYTVQSTGALRQLTVAADGCNAYSAANVADIKAHSNHQYVTLSGNITNFRKLLSSATLQSAAIDTLTNFTVSSGFSGVEIDWENFSAWTVTDYANYRNFVTALQNSLHAQGKFLMIDAPAISDAKYQSYFLFKYEDFVNIDYVAIMAYDYQYDYGVGQPVAPELWVKNVINWAKARLDINKIIIGVPAYGYHGELGSYSPTIDTHEQSSTYPGYSTRKLNADGEETWVLGNTYYAVQSNSTLDRKKALIESMGIKNVSVWHLGGNLWFSN